MWLVETISSRGVEFGLSSSGQANQRFTELLFDGHQFANAIEVTSWEDPKFQVAICEQCAVEHCSSGGWVQLRRVGSFVLFAPCGYEWHGEAEYLPPYVVARRGVPALSYAQYSKLRALIPSLPPEPPHLVWREAIDLVRFDALAFHIDPTTLTLESFVTVSTGSLRDRLHLLLRALSVDAAGPAQASARLASRSDEVITFYVDQPGTPEWSPLVITGDGETALYSQPIVLQIASHHP